jgi:cyclophilin family peptidyl-prolyl cis-trans isomerase
MADNPKISMATSLGEITVELYPEDAPLTVANFLTYVGARFYDGTIFHRVVPDFVVQGGGFTPELQQKATRATIKNEAGNGLKNTRGTLSMARTSAVDSATSQFFISLKDNPALDHRGETAEAFGYCVFGRVTAGMEVVDAMAKVKTGVSGRHRDVPQTAIVMTRVAVLPATGT